MQDGDEFILAERASVVPELLVTDLERSVTAYTDEFGFEVEIARPGVAILRNSAGGQLILEQYDSEATTPTELQTPFGRGVTLWIRVEHPGRLYQSLRGDKYPIVVPMQVAEYTDADGETQSRSEFVIADPDGYLLRFTD